MAIIEELGLEVKVQSDGSSAAEYADEEPNNDDSVRSQTTKISHRYVEVVDDAEFAIHVGLIPGNNTARDWIASIHHDRHTSKVLEGIRDHENQVLRKFRFAPVSIVDDTTQERVATDTKVAQNLGLIRVCVRRGTWTKVPESQNRPQHGPSLGAGGFSLAERPLKGKVVSHGTALSAPVQSPRKSSSHFGWNIDFIDSNNSPLAVFYFKYRSKEALQQLQIIPARSPSVEPDLGTLSLDEIRRLALERLSQMKDGKKRVEPVKGEDDAQVSRPERPFKYVRIEGGKKAIDLTEDD